jgi:hypothetical protein
MKGIFICFCLGDVAPSRGQGASDSATGGNNKIKG